MDGNESGERFWSRCTFSGRGDDVVGIVGDGAVRAIAANMGVVSGAGSAFLRRVAPRTCWGLCVAELADARRGIERRGMAACRGARHCVTRHDVGARSSLRAMLGHSVSRAGR